MLRRVVCNAREERASRNQALREAGGEGGPQSASQLCMRRRARQTRRASLAVGRGEPTSSDWCSAKALRIAMEAVGQACSRKTGQFATLLPRCAVLRGLALWPCLSAAASAIAAAADDQVGGSLCRADVGVDRAHKRARARAGLGCQASPAPSTLPSSLRRRAGATRRRTSEVGRGALHGSGGSAATTTHEDGHALRRRLHGTRMTNTAAQAMTARPLRPRPCPWPRPHDDDHDYDDLDSARVQHTRSAAALPFNHRGARGTLNDMLDESNLPRASRKPADFGRPRPNQATAHIAGQDGDARPAS